MPVTFVNANGHAWHLFPGCPHSRRTESISLHFLGHICIFFDFLCYNQIQLSFFNNTAGTTSVIAWSVRPFNNPHSTTVSCTKVASDGFSCVMIFGYTFFTMRFKKLMSRFTSLAFLKTVFHHFFPVGPNASAMPLIKQFSTPRETRKRVKVGKGWLHSK